MQERLDALGPAPRAELLHVLTLPDFEWADRIGEFWSYPQGRAFAELLIECEEDRTLGRCWSGCCEKRTAGSLPRSYVVLGQTKYVRRIGEKVFGVVAIVAGIGLIAAVIAGVEVSSVVLIMIPLVVIGWSIYHYVVVRSALWGVKPPDASDDHEAL